MSQDPRSSTSSNDDKNLCSKFRTLRTWDQPYFLQSTSEYYYSIIDAKEAEKKWNLSKKIKNLPSTSPSSSSSRKKKRKRDKRKVDDVTEKIKNINMNTKNDGSSSSRQYSPEKWKRNKVDELINQIEQWERGGVKQYKNKTYTNSNKQSERNRQEVIELTQKIKSKIRDNIKPRLEGIINKTRNGIINENVFLLSQSPRKNGSVGINKTMLPTNVEIYRYSIQELYQLQSKCTYELVPRLLELDICRTSLSEVETFILLLLNASHEEREKLILKKAEKLMIIKRTDETGNFKFISNEEASEMPQKEEEKKSEIIDINNLRLIAKSDEELNNLIYEAEFKNLFQSELRSENLQDQSFENLVKYLIDSGKAYIVKGEIRVNQTNLHEAYVSQQTIGMKDICINRFMLRKYAFHGDFVKVIVKQSSEDIFVDSPHITPDDDDLNESNQFDEIATNERNFGCVLEILEERHSRNVIGSFTSFANITKNRKYLTVNVRDPRIPNIRVSTRTGIPRDIALSEKLLLVVKITDWIHDQPNGKVMSIIGEKGELKTENRAILLQNNLDPQPFPESIISSLPSEPYVIPRNEFEYRLDLRSKCVFSIDPESARDLDDALSCDLLPNGNYEIGIHISDVSFFVKEDSELDLIVKNKATTIYLVDAVYHMLPEQLCLLCSLLPGTDKMAFSAIFEIDPDTAEICSTQFTRSIINSCAKLNYDHAQAVIDKKKSRRWEKEVDFPKILNNFTVADVADRILKLQKIAFILRSKRKANGSLKIDQPKLAFKFKKDDERMEAPIDFYSYPIRDSNRLIEEFMLLANISVAAFINENFPETSLLRQHAPPNENGVNKLLKKLTNYGIKMDMSSSKMISKTMNDTIMNAKYPMAMNAALNHLISRTMSRAKYYCNGFAETNEDYWHYALSMPIYTHFTSPIRRYADILVHRVLSAALNYEDIPTRMPEEIQMNANVCNDQKYAAKLAGDDSTNLYFMHFVQSLQCVTMKAAVVGIYDYNLEVVLIDSGHLIKVYYKNLQSDPDIATKCFLDNSPPYITLHQMVNSVVKKSLNIEFGTEILVRVEVKKDKLVINRIFLN